MLDIRNTADRRHFVVSAHADGILYRRANIVQVWWSRVGGDVFDPPVRETWTAPNTDEAEAEFRDMAERWADR